MGVQMFSDITHFVALRQTEVSICCSCSAALCTALQLKRKKKQNTHTHATNVIVLLMPVLIFFISLSLSTARSLPVSRVCSLFLPPRSPSLARARACTLSVCVMLSRALSLHSLALFLSRSLSRSFCSSSLWVAFLYLVTLPPLSCRPVSAFFQIRLFVLLFPL